MKYPVAKMNKLDLRQACREHGIKYGKLNTEGMRLALAEIDVPEMEVTVELPEAPVAPVEPTSFEMPVEELTEQEGRPVNFDPPVVVITTPVVFAKRSWKVEKDRVRQNGVTRPSVNTRCWHVWEALDAHYAQHGTPTVATAKAIATVNGWNVANASAEFYAWRKFTGVAIETEE